MSCYRRILKDLDAMKAIYSKLTYRYEIETTLWDASYGTVGR